MSHGRNTQTNNMTQNSLPVSSRTLQRKCACENQTIADNECKSCKKEKFNLQRRASGSANKYNQIPSVVHDVLRSPGQPLAPNTLAFMEPKIGHDFSQVRIHTDSKATESARAVNAIAYTVGKNIVFQSTYYKPNSTEGKRILAHELTHVVQQTQKVQQPGRIKEKIEVGESDNAYEREANTVANKVMKMTDSDQRVTGAYGSTNNNSELQRIIFDGNSSPLGRETGRESTLPYREATELATCVRIMGENNTAYCRQEVLGETAPAPAQPPFVSCEPSQKLTWANFTGSPSGGHSAFTAYDYPTASTFSGTRIRATFNSGRSFVRPQFSNPTDATLNGCATNISNCQGFFPAGSTGSSFSLISAPSTSCPASIRSNPSVVASSLNDCTGIIATECQRIAQAESDRLLRHEQLHFNIACVLASKANSALVAGSSLTTVQAALSRKDATLTAQYDADTQHGCITSQQATWTTNVEAELPSTTIP